MVAVLSSVFSGNAASERGGAIYVTMSSSVSVSASTFLNNSAVLDGGSSTVLYLGGAIYVDGGSSVVIVDSTFATNSGNSGVSGGAVYFFSTNSERTLSLAVNRFTGNKALICDAIKVEVSSLETMLQWEEAGSTSCTLCVAGAYKSARGNTACDTCGSIDENLVTPSTGALSSAECVCNPTGNFVLYRASTGQCEDCQIGSYRAYDVDAPITASCNLCLDLGDNRLTTEYDNTPRCISCTGAVNCGSMGLTLHTLNLKPGYWRRSRDTADIRLCMLGDGACTGGVGAGIDEYCAPFHYGPYCNLCRDGYYIGSARKCVLCDDVQVVSVTGARWGFRFVRIPPSLLISLRVSGRSLISFLQIVLLIERAYGVALPVFFNQFLSIFRFITVFY
ncbi:hypothetical protein T492DRAFT_867384 [Pavlovales sp. CCMP2436]|nr:hypothetical protein T492DRAFT_867384 [Pavlovales sp. CCMP2436]